MRVEAWVEVGALWLALWAALKSLPRVPDLDWKQVFADALRALQGLEPQGEPLPYAALGPQVDRAAVARWAPVAQVLRHRFAHVVVASVDASEWGAALAQAVPGCRHVAVRAEGREVEDDEAAGVLADALAAPVAGDRPARLVVVTSGEAVLSLLAALRVDEPLRDRLAAVIAIAGDVRADPDWLDRWFNHDDFDVELDRPVPYIALGATARPARAQRFPTPPRPPSGRVAIDAIDLGQIDLIRADRDTVARALWVVLALRLA